MTGEGRERGNVVADGAATGDPQWNQKESPRLPEVGYAAHRATVAESTGDMPISVVPANSGPSGSPFNRNRSGQFIQTVYLLNRHRDAALCISTGLAEV